MLCFGEAGAGGALLHSVVRFAASGDALDMRDEGGQSTCLAGSALGHPGTTRFAPWPAKPAGQLPASERDGPCGGSQGSCRWIVSRRSPHRSSGRGGRGGVGERSERHHRLTEREESDPGETLLCVASGAGGRRCESARNASCVSRKGETLSTIFHDMDDVAAGRLVSSRGFR